MARQTGTRGSQTSAHVRASGARPRVSSRETPVAQSGVVQQCFEELTRLTLDIKQQLQLTSP